MVQKKWMVTGSVIVLIFGGAAVHKWASNRDNASQTGSFVERTMASDLASRRHAMQSSQEYAAMLNEDSTHPAQGVANFNKSYDALDSSSSQNK